MKVALASLVLAVSVGFGPGPAQSSGYVVIVHPDNPVSSISKKELSAYLLKERSQWPGGVEARPVDQVASSSSRRAFSRAVHGRSAASIKDYWQQQIFSGDGVPPPEVAGDDEVVAHVRRNRGGIGYVSRSMRLEGGKELAIPN